MHQYCFCLCKDKVFQYMWRYVERGYKELINISAFFEIKLMYDENHDENHDQDVWTGFYVMCSLALLLWVFCSFSIPALSQNDIHTGNFFNVPRIFKYIVSRKILHTKASHCWLMLLISFLIWTWFVTVSAMSKTSLLSYEAIKTTVPLLQDFLCQILQPNLNFHDSWSAKLAPTQVVVLGLLETQQIYLNHFVAYLI